MVRHLSLWCSSQKLSEFHLTRRSWWTCMSHSGQHWFSQVSQTLQLTHNFWLGPRIFKCLTNSESAQCPL
jgi:hypothetical protein